MNRSMPHPDPETLLRLADQDLPAAESTEIGGHLAGCEQCREQLAALREALDGYHGFHREILKASLPPPPHEWPPLSFPKTGRTRIRPAPWLAAAAAIAALLVGARLFERAPQVRAAELLRKAAAAEMAAPLTHGRIRIRTRSHSLDRAARLLVPGTGPADSGESALRGLFDAAGYGWEHPLSVEAFARWRDSLPEKEDRVERSAGVYLVRTSTTQGPLSDAALSLRASDLHAFACTLRFRSGGEIIFITELPDETPLPHVSGAPPEPSRTAPPAPPGVPTPGGELRVIAALHAIGADLGEPIDVERGAGAIEVRVTGLGQHRRDQIRTALSGIPFVQLRLEDLQQGYAPAPLAPPKSAAPAARSNPLIAGLAARLGNGTSISGLTDELIDVTDRASQRAFALRALARRFPVEAESQMSTADSATLRGILQDHTAALLTALREIRRLVAPLLTNVPAPPAPASPPDWQAIAEELPAAVDRLDRTLNGATDAGEARKVRLAQSIADLDRQSAALQAAVGQ